MELIEKGETELLSTLGKSTTISHNVYKTIATQLVHFAELSNSQAIEIERLQELLRRNNIQFTLPAEPVKFPENTANVIDAKLETPPTTEL